MQLSSPLLVTTPTILPQQQQQQLEQKLMLLKVSTCQFENRSNDKAYNLSVIERLSRGAAAEGSQVAVFHECSITGYTFARKLSREQLFDCAEVVPSGPSVQRLISIAKSCNIAILAGLFEKNEEGTEVYKAYVCVDGSGLKAKYRKLHPFINPSITPGDGYCVFELCGWKCGILICYDNNIIENVRATTLLGAQIIFMPHGKVSHHNSYLFTTYLCVLNL